MGLSIKDILLLDYFDGKPAHHKVPPYKESIYGRDANDRIGELFDDGWIRMSRPQETLTMLPDKALSDFLKRYDLSVKAHTPSSWAVSSPKCRRRTMLMASRRSTSLPRKGRRRSDTTWPTY